MNTQEFSPLPAGPLEPELPREQLCELCRERPWVIERTYAFGFLGKSRLCNDCASERV